MKLKSVIIVIAVGLSILGAPSVSATQKPIVESFTFTPTEMDVQSESRKIDFELIVSHPFGIENITTFVSLTGTKNNKMGLILTRTNLIEDTQRVIFKGSLNIDSNVIADVYTVVADPIKNNASAGYQFWTGYIKSSKIRNLVGGESGLLIRTGGNLNLEFPTIVGPAYDINTPKTFLNPSKFSGISSPIWKVGEFFDPKNYFELQVPDLTLGIESSTPNVCASLNSNLKFNSVGLCTFKVFTEKSKDYLGTSITQSVTITEARIKPVLQVPIVKGVDSKNLPKSIDIPPVYSILGGYIQPKNLTPQICFATTFFVRIFSGGKCSFEYQSGANLNYIESEIYEVSFEVTRDPQTITFTLPSAANVSTRSITLAATASSGGAITYSSASAGICSITGSTLNLLRNGNCAVTATQAGTSTLAPASATATVVLSGDALSNRKTITCVKGKNTKRVSGVNPKCPRGFKIKR